MKGILLIMAILHHAPQRDEPPFIQTGADVVAMCDVSSEAAAYRCEGMLDALADQTEAARWRDQCPPMIEAVPVGTPPYIDRRVLRAAKEHPDWLKLTAVEFVDRVERQARCHPTPP